MQRPNNVKRNLVNNQQPCTLHYFVIIMFTPPPPTPINPLTSAGMPTGRDPIPVVI